MELNLGNCVPVRTMRFCMRSKRANSIPANFTMPINIRLAWLYVPSPRCAREAEALLLRRNPQDGPQHAGAPQKFHYTINHCMGTTCGPQPAVNQFSCDSFCEWIKNPSPIP